MLPQVPPAKLLGAVLAYRGVFELLPLIVALLALVWVEMRSKKSERLTQSAQQEADDGKAEDIRGEHRVRKKSKEEKVSHRTRRAQTRESRNA
jgi:hypothetical protein